MRVDVQSLITWADRLDCRAKLPELIRRLVHSTVKDLSYVDFASDEGIGRPGFDGVVRAATGNAFVPTGSSVWELGCTQHPKAKAETDYKKRTAGQPGVDPATTTYVFVTPRRWVAREEWAHDKRSDQLWRDVRVYDADLLVQWLELSPSASSWLSRLLGRPSDAQALEYFFEEWSLRTSPTTPHTLLLAGREEEQWATLDWLRAAPGVVSIQAPHADEAVAFVYSVICQAAGKTGDQLLDRAVVVQSDASLRTIAADGTGLVIVALECSPEVARAVAGEHHVICATSGNAIGNRIVLGPLDRTRIAAVLETVGFDAETATRVARESGGQVHAVRGLLGDPGVQLPTDLAPLLLAGGWSEASEADLEVLGRIAALPREELLRILRTHSVGPGAPLARTGMVWSWRSRLDAWRSLRDALTPADLARFRDEAVAVLSAVDPQFDLSPEERWMAPVRDIVLPYSPALRRSLADTAAILGALGGPEHRRTAEAVVHNVLSSASTWRAWATLDRFLPTLAEAAPGIFFRHVRRLVQEEAMVRDLRMSSANGPLNWSDYLNGIVGGLEVLAWHTDFFHEACELLVRLAEVEAQADGRRAKGALREILLPWLPHTTAPIEERLAAIKMVADRGAEGFRLLLALLPPMSSDISMGTQKPSWQPWLSSWTSGVSAREIHETHSAIWDLVVDLASNEPQRWRQVIPHLHQLSVDKHRPRAINAIGKLDPTSLPDVEREALRTTLRSELHRHRAYPDTAWALKDDELLVLETIYQQLASANLVRRVAWLFEIHPDLPDFRGRDWEVERAAIESARSRAIAELLASPRGAQNILELATQENAWTVGRSVASVDDSNMLRTIIGDSLLRPWAPSFRAGLANGLAKSRSARDVLNFVRADEFSGDVCADFCVGLPFDTHTWEIVDQLPASSQSRYWSSARPFLHENRPGELTRAVHELVAVDRVPDAIDLMGLHLHRFKDEADIDRQDIVDVLSAALRVQPASLSGMHVHHASELLDVLAAGGPEWEGELAQLEWAWLRQLDHTRAPRVLFRELASNPRFFVDVLSLVFRSDLEAEEERETAESAEERRARVENAYDLLYHWNGLPGLQEDGTIDQRHLRQWVAEVRRLATDAGRAEIGDQKVGEVLARSPVGSDGLWPHEVVRELLESLRNIAQVQVGFVIGRRNQRGVFTKAIGEGGQQEREIASQYRAAADALRRHWTVTARFLRELADGYEDDAHHEDIRGARAKATLVRATGTEERLAVWVDELQARGRYSFDLDDAAEGLARPNSEVEKACNALAERARLACPEPEFYVVVPLEYRSAKCPPATWFIDNWMNWRGSQYAVGLLTSASVYGAAHQQPQTFQVLTDAPSEEVTLGRVRIGLVHDPSVDTFAATQMNTETGTMRVLTPEATAVSLLHHTTNAGGLDAVAGVLLELADECNAELLAQEVRATETTLIQRLGYLLDQVGATTLADRLYAELRTRSDTRPVRLRSGERTDAQPQQRWFVVVERPIEIDE